MKPKCKKCGKEMSYVVLDVADTPEGGVPIEGWICLKCDVEKKENETMVQT